MSVFGAADPAVGGPWPACRSHTTCVVTNTSFSNFDAQKFYLFCFIITQVYPWSADKCRYHGWREMVFIVM